MRLLALFLLAGCHEVFGLKELPSPEDAGTDALDASPDALVTCGASSRVRVDFTTETDMLTRFDRFDVAVDNGAKIEVVDRMLVATTGVQVGYADIKSNQPLDMTKGSVSVRLVGISGQPNSETFFGIHANDATAYFFSVEPDGVGMALKIDGQRVTGTAIAYDPAAHRYLRIHHDDTTSEMVFSTSIDGALWIPRHRISVWTQITAMHARIGAGAYSPGSMQPGTGVFDDFEYCR